MHKRLLLGCLVLVLAGCATAPSSPDAAKSRAAAAANTPPPGCVGTTATRLPINPGDCAGPGRTFTQQDINRTGAQSAGQALRMLDPALSISD